MAYPIAHVYDDTPGHFGMRVALVNRSTDMSNCQDLWIMFF
jgi:hypothetical protein